MSSQSEVNKTVAVLTGSRLKFTVTIIKKSGVKFEVQTDYRPDTYWDEASRAVLFGGQVGSEYGKTPICAWDDVECTSTEENK